MATTTGTTLRILAVGALALPLLLSARARAGVVKPDEALVKAAPKPFPVAAWDAMLKKHVDAEGRVDYAKIDRGALDTLYAALAASGPKSHPDLYKTKPAKLAYYINGYNLAVWKNVLQRLPKMKSVDDEKVSFFGLTKFAFGGEELSLHSLENDVVRKQFGDARVHMALNCASGGCPRLPRHAFTADKLDEQLSAEAKLFCNEKRNVDYDAAAKTVKLSRIFDWYKDDFGKEPGKIIAWINNYRDAAGKIAPDAKISHVDYDWHLNDPSLKR
jgi:hypothetical protein